MGTLPRTLRRATRRARTLLALAGALLCWCTGAIADADMYFTFYVDHESERIDLTPIFCEEGNSRRMFAIRQTRSGEFLEIGSYELVGKRIRVHFQWEDLDFDQADERFEWRRNLCPKCEPTVIEEFDNG